MHDHGSTRSHWSDAQQGSEEVFFEANSRHDLREEFVLLDLP